MKDADTTIHRSNNYNLYAVFRRVVPDGEQIAIYKDGQPVGAYEVIRPGFLDNEQREIPVPATDHLKGWRMIASGSASDNRTVGAALTIYYAQEQP